MKKVLLLILSLFVSPAFASGINANSVSAPCTNTTLETYSGNTNLQADWQPNTIDLRWYNNNTLMSVQSSANTCVYDSSLTIPSTAPTRTGYTFAGWQVRPTYDFSTLSINTEGTECWAIGLSSTDGISNVCWNSDTVAYNIVDCDSHKDFAELEQYEWKVAFEWGDIYGSSYCSAHGGDNHDGGWGGWNNENNSDWLSTYDVLESASGEQKYCWCQVTGYKPSNSNTTYGPINPIWVYRNSSTTGPNCRRLCPAYCAVYTLYAKYLRRALFAGY